MKSAIVYFTGTGNSLDISQRLKEHIDGDVLYMKDTDIGQLKHYDTVVIVTPVYSFGLPVPVEKFIAAMGGMSDKKFYVILHFAGFAANAAYAAQRLFEKNGLTVQNVYNIRMPVSFTIVATPPKGYVQKTLKKSQQAVMRIANCIKNGEAAVQKSNAFAFLDKIHDDNAARWARLPEKFKVTDECNGCGHCADICPVDNIEMVEGRPIFGAKCVACLACYNRCPRIAIAYGNKKTKKRYKNANVKF